MKPAGWLARWKRPRPRVVNNGSSSSAPAHSIAGLRPTRQSGVSAADLTPLGVLLESRRETTKSLEQATVRVRRLDAIPAADVRQLNSHANTKTVQETQLEIDVANA